MKSIKILFCVMGFAFSSLSFCSEEVQKELCSVEKQIKSLQNLLGSLIEKRDPLLDEYTALESELIEYRKNLKKVTKENKGLRIRYFRNQIKAAESRKKGLDNGIFYYQNQIVRLGWEINSLQSEEK